MGDKKELTLGELARHINAELVGDPQYTVSALATLQNATKTDLSFIANPAYKKYLPASHAGAVIINSELTEMFSGNKLIVPNPYLSYAQLSKLFDQTLTVSHGIHESAVIGKNCLLGEGVCVQANAVIADGVVLGDGVFVGAGCSIGEDSVIGEQTRIHPNATIYHGVNIGSYCIIHSGSVIGADGFGFSHSKDGWIKIHQLGGVVIGNNVEIGANTTIDRGALDNTIIGDGVIIDNLVQIAHNVRIGKNTAIAANVGIAGSCVLGDNCVIAGGVGIVGHLTLADNVQITAMSLITNSIKEPGSYSSGTAQGPTKEWRKNAARFRSLDALASRLIQLERHQKDK
ncbi:MAG: UDP-3-O-(3-hydroxymyristoyl)glucosamine N-acyltransferase [Moraxellaceae bacterium]|nr:MAG: UDP-3-O-(3-hydroxymyristoyl)glucosamine N-acyltransferase [Moraxellaceae bacterium]